MDPKYFKAQIRLKMTKISIFHLNNNQIHNFLELRNEGFRNINLAENFQKRIKRAARLLDRLE